MNQATAQQGFSDLFNTFGAFQKESMEKMMKTWSDALSGNNPMNAFGSGNMKDNPIAAGLSDYLDTVRNTVKGVMDMSETVMPNMPGADMASFSGYMESLPDIPARMMKKILAIPPVGITRPYQEKINKTLDKWTVFNTAAMEFMATTFVPMEEATRITLKEILKQSEAMKTPEDIQKVYDKWLKIMESEYQALFKTDRYKHIIAKIFSAMAEFRAASRELVLDLMTLSGFPFGREVDELCKDMFDLKKKIKVMEAQIKKMEESTVH